MNVAKLYISDKRITVLSNTWFPLNKTGEGLPLYPGDICIARTKKSFTWPEYFDIFAVYKDEAAIFPGSSFGIYICIWAGPCEDCPKRTRGGRYSFFHRGGNDYIYYKIIPKKYFCLHVGNPIGLIICKIFSVSSKYRFPW